MSNHQRIIDKGLCPFAGGVRAVSDTGYVCAQAPLPEEVWGKEPNLVFVEAK
jgi:hypothetical protein